MEKVNAKKGYALSLSLLTSYLGPHARADLDKGEARILRNFEKHLTTQAVEQCWFWTGTLTHRGYGQFGVGSKTFMAHRVSYVLFCGEIPEGKFVLHSCDNKNCCNPSHLRLGLHEDNVQDALDRKRYKPMIGEDHVSSTLSALEVLEIMERLRKGEAAADIARMYNVGDSTIRSIYYGRTWCSVTGGEIRNAGETRYAEGSRQHNAKFLEEDILHIRDLHKRGISFLALSKQYGVHKSTIQRIVTGKTWKRVPGVNVQESSGGCNK